MIQFENIQRLEGHHGEIWALAVSNFANFVVTGSHDKSIRIWEKLDEPVRIQSSTNVNSPDTSVAAVSRGGARARS